MTQLLVFPRGEFIIMECSLKSHARFKLLIIVIMFFVAAGLLNLLSFRVVFEHEKITFVRYPVVYAVLFLIPGFGIGLSAIFYRYWHARGGIPLSYLRALFDISLASAPVLLYLVLRNVPESKNVSDHIFLLLFTPAEVLFLFYRGITGTTGLNLNALGDLAMRIVALAMTVALLALRSKKVNFTLVLAAIASSYLVALLLGTLQGMIVGALD